MRRRGRRSHRPARARPHRADVRMTFSLVAHDREARQWGVAVQSKFLAVGSGVPWAEPDAGAIATQAYASPRYGPAGLALLREGVGSAEAGARRVDAGAG